MGYQLAPRPLTMDDLEQS